jgi:hypothetical protein
VAQLLTGGLDLQLQLGASTESVGAHQECAIAVMLLAIVSTLVP